MTSVTVELTEEETTRLVKEAPRAYRTEINDVLLTALGKALGEWSGERRVAVDLEGHGREDIAEGAGCQPDRGLVYDDVSGGAGTG